MISNKCSNKNNCAEKAFQSQKFQTETLRARSSINDGHLLLRYV